MKLYKQFTLALCACLCLTAVLLAAPSAFALTARVHVVDGVPRLVVNGRPMRPRMFWGGPGSAPLRIETGRHALSFTFSPVLDEPKASTIHFRFTHQASTIVIERIHIVDLTTGQDVIPNTKMGDTSFGKDWFFWPANDNDNSATVSIVPAGAQIAMHDPPPGKDWSDTHIYHNPNFALYHDHRYQLDLTVTTDKPTEAVINLYHPGNTFVFLGTVQKDAFKDQLQLAAAAGVNIVEFSLFVPWPKADEKPDYSQIDAICDYILKTNPKALLLPRIYLLAPDWWLDSHPGDEMRWDKQAGHGRNTTVSSLSFRVDAAQKLTALIDHWEATYGEHMLGYHVAGQSTDEWFYQDSWGPDWNGYAQADTFAWRAWLTQHYGSDAALQKAWNRTDVTLANALPPTPDERRAGNSELRDPATQRNVIAWNRFQQDDMADEILYFAHIVRQATHGTKLCAFFYGYLCEFGGMVNGVANSGHYALRRIIDSPDIDCAVSPWSYGDRGIEGSGPVMSAIDSDALAGKLYIAEDDTWTHLSHGFPPSATAKVPTDAETHNILLRNTAQMSLRNIGTWWMDIGKSGWFDDPGYWKMLEQFSPVESYMLEHAQPFHPQIASIIDEESAQWLGYGNRVGTLLPQSHEAIGRAGAPYGQYLQEDVISGKVHAKLYAFLTAWSLTESQRLAILKATQGATRIWCYAPGYYDGVEPSLDAMHQLTGFQFKIVTPAFGWATATDQGIKLGLTPNGFGAMQPLRPTFAVTDAKSDEVLATYPDGSVAVAMRKGPIGTSIFCGVPVLTPELVRIAAKAAGVHLYTTTNATVFANGPFLAVHASVAGPITIDTGSPNPITDVMTGQKIGKGPTVTLPFELGDTRVFRY